MVGNLSITATSLQQPVLSLLKGDCCREVSYLLSAKFGYIILKWSFQIVSMKPEPCVSTDLKQKLSIINIFKNSGFGLSIETSYLYIVVNT